VREVREMLLAVAAARGGGGGGGRPILLAVKVPEDLAGCRTDGLDVGAWLEAGLVDILILGNRTTTVDVAGFRALRAARPGPVAVALCPMFDRHHATDGYYDPPAGFHSAVFANFWAQGADSVGMFNWPCAPPQAHLELGLSPHTNPVGSDLTDMVAEAGRGGSALRMGPAGWIFAVERRGGYPWQEGAANANARRLPAPLPNSRDARDAVQLPLFVHAHRGIPPGARLVLQLVLSSAVAGDALRVTLNGSPALGPIDGDARWVDGQVYATRPQPTAGSQAAYASEAATTGADPLLRLRFDGGNAKVALRAGENVVAVSVTDRGVHTMIGDGAKIGMRIVVEKVEAHVSSSASSKM
jgi:hypothetical protein